MHTTNSLNDQPELRPGARISGGYAQSRLRNFGATMAVMGASFALYYMGLFGGVSGPLQPAFLGDWLAGLGFRSHHVLGLFLALTLISMVWNWVYNALNRMFHWRLRCTAITNDSGGYCTEPIVKRTGKEADRQYICRAGHAGIRAEVPVLRKGTLGHFLWMMFLIFSVIVYYHMA